MKRILAVLAGCTLTAVALALNIPTPPAASTTQPTPGKFVVHEWGTFTGFAGSDGIHIPFGIDVGSGLPAFVLNRKEQAVHQNVAVTNNDLFSKGGGVYALQRMETPVIYFYTPEPRDVTVAVNFPKGLLTEFFPPVREMKPAFGEGPGEYNLVPRPLDSVRSPTTRPETKFEKGSLDWGAVRLLPQIPGQYSSIPEVPKNAPSAAHYQYARETDAATVQLAGQKGETYQERFLFYRGLGNFKLPLTLTALGNDHFQLYNAGEKPIRFALLLNITDQRARFTVYSDIQGRQPMALPAETVSIDQVGSAITRALIAEGLYEKEARAMVKTWSANWLGEPGTRVLYTLPREVTDSLLPLKIAPAPDQTVRVLIGRIDVMTPELESKVQSLMAVGSKTKTLPPDDADCLRNLGRFFEPAMDRAAKLRANPNAANERNTLRWLYYNSPKPTPATSPSPAS
jgi:hypothetical protein